MIRMLGFNDDRHLAIFRHDHLNVSISLSWSNGLTIHRYVSICDPISQGNRHYLAR